MMEELRKFFANDRIMKRTDVVPHTDGCTIGAAVLKQISFKPEFGENDEIICPACKQELLGDLYCGKCGQKIMWQYDKDVKVVDCTQTGINGNGNCETKP